MELPHPAPMTASAEAHVAEVTTTVSLAEVSDSESLARAIGQMVDKARAETIAFEPSVVAVTGVRVFGERVLISLLFADATARRCSRLSGILTRAMVDRRRTLRARAARCFPSRGSDVPRLIRSAGAG